MTVVIPLIPDDTVLINQNGEKCTFEKVQE
jgi:hypothetical protein